MSLGLRASLAGAVVAVAACSSSFSSSPGDDAGPADASMPDVGMADGSAPDSAADTAPGVDAVSPAEGGTADGGSTWCSTQHATFCEDFDTYSNVTAFLSSTSPMWTYSALGGTFAFDSMNVPSPPNALHVTTTSTSNVRNLAFHELPAMSGAGVKSQRLEFQLRINEAKGIDGISAAAVAAIVFGKDVTSGAVALAFGNGNTENPATLAAVFLGPMPDSGLPAYGSANGPPPFPTLGQWDGTFALEIDYGPATDAGPSACAQIYVGAFAQLSPCLALPPSLSRPLSTSIALGVYSGGLGTTGTVDVEFDNVLYDAQ